LASANRATFVGRIHGLCDHLDPLGDAGRARLVRHADDGNAGLLDQAQGIGRACTLRGDDERRIEGQDALGSELADITDILLRLQRLLGIEARRIHPDDLIGTAQAVEDLGRRSAEADDAACGLCTKPRCSEQNGRCQEQRAA
jgi:hypothetical protein